VAPKIKEAGLIKEMLDSSVINVPRWCHETAVLPGRKGFVSYGVMGYE